MVGVAVAAVLGVWYLKGKAKKALDVTDRDNVVNTWFDSVYDGGFDGKGTLGTDIADINYEYSPYVLGEKARERIKGWWDSMFTGADG